MIHSKEHVCPSTRPSDRAKASSSNTGTNTTEHVPCQGPLFLPTEFKILSNRSVLILPHQKNYSKDSYVLVNRTLVLCSNVSRNYTKTSINVVKENPPDGQSLALRIITSVGFSLSIAALLFLLVTYFLFAKLGTYPGKMVMHLSCAMIAMQSVYFASDADVFSSAVCAATGAFLHYFILTIFLWMSVIAHNSQKTLSSPSK